MNQIFRTPHRPKHTQFTGTHLQLKYSLACWDWNAYCLCYESCVSVFVAAKTEWSMKKGSEHKPKSSRRKPQDFALYWKWVLTRSPRPCYSPPYKSYPLHTNLLLGLKKWMSCHCQSTDARPNKLFLGVLNLAFCIVSFLFLFFLFLAHLGNRDAHTKLWVVEWFFFLFFFGWVGLLGNSATYLQKKAQ